MNTTQTVIALSSKKAHLVIDQNEFNELGFATSSTKRAIVPIQEGKNPEEVLAAAKQYSWTMEGERDNNGFYSAVAGAKIAVAPAPAADGKK
jgi:isocitrate lyase